MESYVIRIYRRDEHNPQAIIGLVEDIGLDATTSFHNTEELTEIITGKNRKSKKDRKRRNNQSKKQI